MKKSDNASERLPDWERLLQQKQAWEKEHKRRLMIFQYEFRQHYAEFFGIPLRWLELLNLENWQQLSEAGHTFKVTAELEYDTHIVQKQGVMYDRFHGRTDTTMGEIWAFYADLHPAEFKRVWDTAYELYVKQFNL